MIHMLACFEGKVYKCLYANYGLDSSSNVGGRGLLAVDAFFGASSASSSRARATRTELPACGHRSRMIPN